MDQNRTKMRRRAGCWIVLGGLCTGSLFSGECTGNLRDSIFTGSRIWAATILDPSNIVGYPFEQSIMDILGGS